MAPPDSSAAQGAVRKSGGARLLAGDARVAFVLVNEARYRAMANVFGATREQANLATFIAGLVLVHQVHERWRRLMDAPMAPSFPDEVIGTAVVRELLSRAAGPGVSDSPQLSNLLLAAVVATGGAPVVVRALRGLRKAGHGADAGFRKRYGYLVDVGQRRARHYESRAREALAARQSS
jgi:hypothetical protein